MHKLTLFVLPERYAFCRLEPDGPIPHWALLGDDFVTLTRTRQELSVVCMEENVPENAQAERGWRCIKVDGSFSFTLAGIHTSLAVPLANANISVMAIATYETDHILVKDENLTAAIDVLKQAGHTFRAI